MNVMPRILLIDDDPAWRETLAEYLQGHGFCIDLAGDARSGLSLLDRQKVALAVIDYHLPDMDGLALLQELKRRQGNVAVLLLSGDENEALPRQARALGASAFLPKTASPPYLLRMVQQVLADAGCTVAAGPVHAHRRHFLPTLARTARIFPLVVQLHEECLN